MTKLLVLSAAAIALLSAAAQARCRDELEGMKPRLEALKQSQPQRYQLVMRWWGRAAEAEPGSELECSNYLERARKALTMPLQADDCAITYQARCAPGGHMAGALYGAYGGGAANGMALGGGGGGGAQVPFTPPGSVDSRSISPEK